MQGPEGRPPNVSPARKGWEIDPEEDPSAVGAALNRSSALAVSLGAYPDFLLHSSHQRHLCVLPKENHMQLTEAATLDRKSGEADLSRPPRLAVGRAVEGSAGPRTLPGNVFRQSAHGPAATTYRGIGMLSRHKRSNRH